MVRGFSGWCFDCQLLEVGPASSSFGLPLFLSYFLVLLVFLVGPQKYKKCLFRDYTCLFLQGFWLRLLQPSTLLWSLWLTLP